MKPVPITVGTKQYTLVDKHHYSMIIFDSATLIRDVKISITKKSTI